MNDIRPLRAVSDALSYIDEELQKDGYDIEEVVYDVDTLTLKMKFRRIRRYGIGRVHG